ncbi:hypothetical protein [Pontimicrobium sp. MEBiC06410]
MQSVEKHISIPKDVATKNDLDFHFLREKGIEYIEQLGSSLWTDLNAHDPGITIMEMLCYAITDLGMRIEMPIENLLASKDSNNTIQNQFYKAADVFPTKALTANDYRKLFIDVKGVKNCWLRKYEKTVYVNCKENKLSYNENDFSTLDKAFKNKFQLKGLYALFIEYDALEEDLTEQEKEDILELVKEAYYNNRNLCEDIVTINTVETQGVSVCANIEVDIEANEEEVHANVLYQINNYFSPELRFYSIKEMLEKGYTPDQIFDGPSLENGFIDIEELKAAELRTEVRLSDLMKILMNIEGVKLIKDISIGHCDASKPLGNDWIICIDPNKKPKLCERSTFNYHKGVLPLNINEAEVLRFSEALKTDTIEAQKVAKTNKNLDIPKGISLETSQYNTIQNDFPDTYGIGLDGLNARATTERKAQAKQLKAYLLFFDKILANYFKHLGKVKDLLSINGSETKTYFTQALHGIKDFDDLVKNYPKANEDALTKLLFDKFDNNIERRNKILDHLLARFAERFGDYTFLMKTLYGSSADEMTLANKEAFLKDYVAISSQRGCAFNYYKQENKALWDTDNVSGFQKRVSRLVGVKNYTRRHLTDSFVEVYKNAPEEYRWRVRNSNNDIVLSSTTNYKTASKASEELYFAILQIIQVSEKTIEKQFENKVENETLIDTIEINKTDAGVYTFQIINPEEPKSSTNYIIAKQFIFYNTLKNLKQGIIDLVDFIKTEFSEEGMFLVEHMLLRPDVTKQTTDEDTFIQICADECDECNIDPYSYRVSIILPGYTYRFSNPDFRRYMENIIKEELPAHILPKICWVGYRRGVVEDNENDLRQFEEAYKNYLFAKTNLALQEQPTINNNEHKKLIDAMSQLNTIYPVGRLLDCNDESDELEGRIILGQTNLGTLKINSDEN